MEIRKLDLWTFSCYKPSSLNMNLWFMKSFFKFQETLNHFLHAGHRQQQLPSSLWCEMHSKVSAATTTIQAPTELQPSLPYTFLQRVPKGTRNTKWDTEEKDNILTTEARPATWQQDWVCFTCLQGKTWLEASWPQSQDLRAIIKTFIFLWSRTLRFLTFHY